MGPEPPRLAGDAEALSAAGADAYSHPTLEQIENHCARLRAFEGRSRLSTYLPTVINWLFLDLTPNLSTTGKSAGGPSQKRGAQAWR